MKIRRNRSHRPRQFKFCPLLEKLEDRVVPSTSWNNFQGNAQHTGVSAVAAAPMDKILWQTTIDQQPWGSEHYGEPVFTPNDTVIMPIKTGWSGGFTIEGLNGATGAVLWQVATDYQEPPYVWLPPFQVAYDPVTDRAYFAGNGGTIYYVSHPDNPGSANLTPVQLAFYGLGNYQSDESDYNNTLVIDTPLTVDSSGTVYFGYTATGGSNPSSITQGGFARIDAAGNGTWRSASAAAGGAGVNTAALGSAPALSNDGTTLYAAVTNGGYKLNQSGEYTAYLVALDSATLHPQYAVRIMDPGNPGTAGLVLDESTAAPMVAPDNTVFFGVFGNPFNGSRGYMLHFSADLSTRYTPGAFGWDDTASIIPASMVPSYTGSSSYLVLTKYNNYVAAETGTYGGNGVNEIAILDPWASQTDPNNDPNRSMLVMKQILTMASPTPDADYTGKGYPDAVREWCTNGTVVDPATDSVFMNNEDGYAYRWNLSTDTLTQAVQITTGIGEPYTPTAIGPNGTVYAINGGTLFALGGLPNYTLTNVSSPAPSDYGQTVTFSTTLAPISPGGATPTGTITYEDGGTALGPAVTLVNGQASFATAALSAAHHKLTAAYSGDGTYAAGSTTLVEAVLEETTTTLTASTNATSLGQSISFTASVSPNNSISFVPLGSITFMDGGMALATVTLNSAEQASFATSSLALGTHQITAVYSGDLNFAGSTSNTQTEAVGTTTSTLTSSANPSLYGQTVTFSVTVAPVVGSGTPTGTVTFMDGSNSLGTVPLTNGSATGGSATLSTSSLSAADHAISVSYSGDSTDAPSTSNIVTQSVYPVPTAGVSGPSDGVAYQPRTFTFTATGAAGDSAVGYTYNINWGDGTMQTVSPTANNTSITETHPYSTTGAFSPSVTVTDQLNATSSPATQAISIGLVEVQSDSAGQGGITGLAISGAASVALTSTGAANTLQVTRGGKSAGTFAATNGNVAVYGDGSADLVTINGIANSANTFTLTGSTATFTAASLSPNVFTIGLSNISSVTFMGGTVGNSFTNTATTVASMLRGPGGVNTYTFAGSSMGAPVTISGGGSNNTVYAPTLSSNQTNVWTVNGSNAGNLNGASWTFSSIQNLVGGANDDDFQFSGPGSISGNIDGGASYSTAGNTLDYSAFNTAAKVNINMAHNTASALGGSWANIETVIGQTSLSASDTLTGPNSAGSWSITGANTGSVNGLAFSGFGNLTGGTAADTFTIGSAASLSGLLNGGGGADTLVGPNVGSTFNITKTNTGNLDGNVIGFTNIPNLTGGTQPNNFVLSNGVGIGGNLTGGAAGDTLNLSAWTISVVLNLQTGKVNGIGGAVSNLAAVIGGNAANTLTGPNLSSTWDITSANAGTLNSSFSFTAFGTLLGGTVGNDFVFSNGATLSGKLDGGAGGGTLDMSAYTANVSVNLATSRATGIGGAATNLVAALGGSGNNTLTGPNLTSAWNITGADSGTLNAFTFTNFGNLTGGTSPDTFTLGSAGSVSGTMNGGAGKNTLVAANTSNVWSITGTSAGSVNSVTFTSIQNLVGGTGVDVFTFGSAGTVASINGGGAPANLGDWLDFSAFTTSVVVNLTTGAATNVNGGAAGSVSNIQNVHGGNGGNTLTGNAQGNILIGGSGTNVINGGSGRSLLIADAGASTITGGSDGSATGGDILVGGTTSFDTMTAANEAALMSILAEWQSADPYDTRFADINTGTGGGLNGSNSLNFGATVQDNGQANTLIANAGTAAVDWFFAAGATVIDTTESGAHINNT